MENEGLYEDYLDNPFKYLGSPVRIYVSNRVRTGKLTEWSDSSQSYSGSVEINVKGEGFNNLPTFVPFKGAVPLGHGQRPDQDFQFVAPGEDESELLAIGTANANKKDENVTEEVDE